MRLWKHALDFFEAARWVHEERSDRPFIITYFLLGQSLELALKAFLRGKGQTKEFLKAVGHDLMTAVEESQRVDLGTLITLDPQERSTIGFLNNLYASKDLQYPESGSKHYPPIVEVFKVARRVLESTKTFCIENRKRHFDKPTAVL